MSHHIYHTSALIIGSYQAREANRHFKLFTKEFGLLTASAQSVRAPLSKLRGGLALFSLSDVAMIHSKSGWRLTNAIEKKAYWPHIRGTPSTSVTPSTPGTAAAEGTTTGANAKKRIAASIAQLIDRLVNGEEKHEKLFDQLVEFFEFLTKEALDEKTMRAFECVAVLRIMSELGYIASNPEIAPFLENGGVATKIDEHMLAHAAKSRPILLSHINNALKVSQL